MIAMDRQNERGKSQGASGGGGLRKVCLAGER